MDSKTVIEALDGIRHALTGHHTGIDYPKIKNGPVEQVLAFNNIEQIVLKDAAGAHPHFSSHGELSDLNHNVLPFSKVETTFPVVLTALPGAFQWPPTQEKPYDAPPVDDQNATAPGPSKQAYFFNGGKDLLVTVGPSLPKIVKLKHGGAQFWVGSIGVIAQGEGIYAEVRGMSVYLGSAYLPVWSDVQAEQIAILEKGFRALVSTYFKVVLKDDHV